MQLDTSSPWQTQDRFLELRTQWMSLIGEHLQDHQGNLLEYWRVEKADSVIVLPIQADRILLPTPSYRPGIAQFTLDFPGGRIPEGKEPAQIAITTLQRELGIAANSIAQLIPLNVQGWLINSSFSNQKLYSFLAYIDETSSISSLVKTTYLITRSEVQELLQQLTCLQCRSVLLEWWFNHQNAI